jgi:GT2 family glycosyltransferase
MTVSYRISVVIPTFQRRASVERTLRALARQTLPADQYEVIVSIDGSEDGTREMVAQFPAPYALQGIWQSNRGRAAACNAGIRVARGDLLVLLDDDMEPEPGCLLAHLQAHAEHARLAVLGAVPVRIDQSSAPVADFINAKFSRHLQKLAQPDYTIHFRDFYTGHISIRRDVLLEVGAFDEDFKVYGNEDSELALRLARAGVKVVYNPEALAYQHYTKDFAALARDNVAKGQTAVLLASKYPEAFHHLRLRTYYQGSRKWRMLRAVLLMLSRLAAGTPKGVIRFVNWLEQRKAARLHFYYDLALDYFFWLGAQPALRANRRAKSGLQSLPKS